MSLKSGKKASLPRVSDRTKEFEKDWKRLSHSGRYQMANLKHVMVLLIANDGPLPPEYLDHPLAGRLAACRECHVGGDFLLLYRLEDDGDTVIFVRAGTHAELFE